MNHEHAQDTPASDLAFDLEQAAERLLRGELPMAISTRWKPLRMGLMNLFLFDDERFPFADGRLLLRGSNGAGKSRVLAMTLPLLLDGSLRPNRVEPDRDPNRQVAWNLLMDDQESRTGYSWLEFGRCEDAGSAADNGSARHEHFLTIGCGMKAVRGQPIKPWFFVTELRVDAGLDLQTPDGVPLTQRQLTETLAERGQVVESARDYRRLIDEHLFRLGERFEPLLDLLLQLRQPQLAKKLDLDQLESALRAALPPLPEALLGDAAEAFRDLDQYRAHLAADRRTLDDVTKFVRPYRDHVQRGVLRCARLLTKANREFENAQRQQRQALEESEQKQLLLDQEQKAAAALVLELAEAEAAIEALQTRPEMQDAARLDQLQTALDSARIEFHQLEQDWQRAAHAQSAAQDKLKRDQRQCEAAFAAAEAAAEHAAAHAAPEALVNRHRELLAPLLAQEPAAATSRDAVQKQLTAETHRWQQAAEHLHARHQAVTAAENLLRDAVRNTANAEAETQRIAEELDAAQSREDAQRDQTWDAIVAWFQEDSPLRTHLPPLGTFSDQWQDWAVAPTGDDPFREAVATADRLFGQQAAREESAFHEQRKAVQLRDDELAIEQQRLESGVPIVPPQPYTRDPQSRDARPQGAPLWQLVDFVEEVPPAERALWEAALEASGLLDAWLASDGTLVDPQRHDTQLVVAAEPALQVERQLRCVLRPADNVDAFGLSEEVVARVLSIVGVGIGAGRVWVERDGRWQNGPLQGCWTKPRVQYIGEAARAQWRAARLAEIAADRAALAAELEQVQHALAELENRRHVAAAQRQRAPSPAAFLQRRAETSAQQAQADQAAHRLRERQRVEQEQRDRVTELVAVRDQDAADVGLAAWVQRIDELRRRLDKYTTLLDVWWVKFENLVAARAMVAESRQQLTIACSQHEEFGQRAEAKRRDLARQESTLRELQASAGQAVAEIMERLAAQRELKTTLADQLDRGRERMSTLKSDLAVLASQLSQHGETSARHDDDRRQAAEWFADVGGTGLLEFAVEELELPPRPWSLTQSLKLARTTDAQLETLATKIDDDAWQRSQNRVYQEHNALQQTVLSQEGMGTDVDHLRDGLQLVTITMQGERISLAGAVERLAADVQQRERILDEKEQETLEKYLLGEVADALRQRMHLAADLVGHMTREVARRPMKTGMQMRFRWQRDPEGPPGLAEACDVLQTVSATWSPQEREQIKLFLARRIREQRDTDAAGSWHEHLRDALDYRSWYRILIARRSGPDAEWKKLTRRTYGSGSGGEKAIALTLPQLAAAAAYYQTADALAPRFILLDEAFAGISPDMRESCLELIAAFDLDVVMTSESEWGCYAGVPQLAICQLDRFAGINAVVNRVYIWNGKQKRAAVVPELAAEQARQPLLPD
jgi:uncharacterized protein (TIGR02680 family)